MKIINLDLNNFSDEDVATIVGEINVGHVGIIPTDTVYGISALATNQQVVKKIYQIKKRDRAKPLIVLMKSFCMLRRYCFLNKYQYDYIGRILEENRPVTVILRGRGGELEHLFNNEGCLAIRIPQKSKFLMQILKKVNLPIVSTSLNLSGEMEILDLSKVENIFPNNEFDFVVNASLMAKKRSSKIIDISDMGNIKIIRG
jgi:L-threonylcarbamoyladenylate synthase